MTAMAVIPGPVVRADAVIDAARRDVLARPEYLLGAGSQ